MKILCQKCGQKFEESEPMCPTCDKIDLMIDESNEEFIDDELYGSDDQVS